jgi:hypothetical protein
MEVPQRNSLCNYLKQQKCHFALPSFAKSENRRAEQVLSEGVDTSVRGKEVGSGCKSEYGANT